MSIALYIVLIGISLGGIHHWIKTKSYIFEHEDIASITRRHVDRGNIHETFARIAKEIENKYPGHIVPERIREWIFLTAGGSMGSVYLLHASLTEYVLFFGTAIDTQGHSGRHWANITDTLLTGSLRLWREGSLESVMYYPGDTMEHLWGEATVVQFTAGTSMVEYGRGFLPASLAFTLCDSIFSTMDFISSFKLLKMYARALVQESLNQLFELIEMTK